MKDFAHIHRSPRMMHVASVLCCNVCIPLELAGPDHWHIDLLLHGLPSSISVCSASTTASESIRSSGHMMIVNEMFNGNSCVTPRFWSSSCADNLIRAIVRAPDSRPYIDGIMQIGGKVASARFSADLWLVHSAPQDACFCRFITTFTCNLR